METYDPENIDDIFGVLQQRVDELVHEYKDLKKKGGEVPVLCAICMDNFRSESVVIRLQCNKMHVFHKQCLFEWYSKSKTCPLCRDRNKHALPINLELSH